MITIQPTGTSATTLTANSVSVLVNVREKLTRAFCTQSQQPQTAVTFTPGSAQYVEAAGATTGTAFVPVTATISVTYTPKGSKTAVTQIFTETFKLAFIAQTAAPTSTVISIDGEALTAADYKSGCKAYGVSVDTAITAVIS